MNLIKLTDNGPETTFCDPLDQAKKKRYADLIERGFQEFVASPPPSDIEEGKILSESFESKEGMIIQYWSLKDDPKFLIKKIEDMKLSLSNTDYKVTKCYESTMLGEELPYDLIQLASERTLIRAEINRIKAIIENL